MKKKGKMAACLILLVLLLAVLAVLTKKNSTADADSGSSDSGADAEKVVDFSKDDVTALSFQIDGETVSFTKTAGDDDTDIWTLQISGSSAGVWRNRSIRRNCACAAMAGRRETALFLWS